MRSAGQEGVESATQHRTIDPRLGTRFLGWWGRSTPWPASGPWRARIFRRSSCLLRVLGHRLPSPRTAPGPLLSHLHRPASPAGQPTRLKQGRPKSASPGRSHARALYPPFGILRLTSVPSAPAPMSACVLRRSSRRVAEFGRASGDCQHQRRAYGHAIRVGTWPK